MSGIPIKMMMRLLVIAWLLAACQTLPATHPPQGEEMTPTPEKTVRVPTATPVQPAAPSPAPLQPLAVDVARKTLAKLISVPFDEISLYTYSAVDWPDSCLGVYTSKKMCADVITPGYLIQLTARGKHYSLHTNADASVVLLATAESYNPPPTGDLALDEARGVLLGFFRLLYAENYAEAARSYGGPQEILQQNNPDIASSDLPALLERACLQNGHFCLPVLEVLESQEIESGVYRFVVTFAYPDGSLFQRGPCCGDNSASSQYKFEYMVRLVGGSYQVMDLPPYVP